MLHCKCNTKRARCLVSAASAHSFNPLATALDIARCTFSIAHYPLLDIAHCPLLDVAHCNALNQSATVLCIFPTVLCIEPMQYALHAVHSKIPLMAIPLTIPPQPPLSSQPDCFFPFFLDAFPEHIIILSTLQINRSVCRPLVALARALIGSLIAPLPKPPTLRGDF